MHSKLIYIVYIEFITHLKHKAYCVHFKNVKCENEVIKTAKNYDPGNMLSHIDTRGHLDCKNHIMNTPRLALNHIGVKPGGGFNSMQYKYLV